MTHHAVTPESVVERAEELVFREVEGHIVIMKTLDGSYHELDLVASRIWELLDRPRLVSSLCEELTSEFAVSSEQCESDVSAFLGKMLGDGLVEIVDGTPSDQ